MINLNIQTDPGEEKKQITIDSLVTGSSDSDPNFKQLFKVYNLSGKRIFGSKADVINLDGFLNYLSKEYNLDAETKKGIQDNYTSVIKDLKNEDGYLTCFWDNTSEVHHRDIMRLCFGEFNKSIKKYDNKLLSSENNLNEDEILTKSEKLDDITNNISNALDQLYEVKVGTSDLSNTAKKILEYCQGYQMSSEAKENENDLWKSKILKLSLSSGMTKDQQKYRINIDPEETKNNIKAFLGSLRNVEIDANSIEIPEEYKIDLSSIPVTSVKTHKNKEGSYLNSYESNKNLRIKYYSQN